jgi:hypothetical protein
MDFHKTVAALVKRTLEATQLTNQALTINSEYR